MKRIILAALIGVILTACGTATTVVRVAYASGGMTIYVSGLSDADRQQFEQSAHKQQGTVVSEVATAPKPTAADCTISRPFQGSSVSMMLVVDSSFPVTILGTPCTWLRNWNVANPTAISSPSPAPVSTTSVALSGVGSKVIDPLLLDPGNYRVSWTAMGSGPSFAADTIGASNQRFPLIIAFAPMPTLEQVNANLKAGGNGEITVPISGAEFFQASGTTGGYYVLAVTAERETWSITFTPLP